MDERFSEAGSQLLLLLLLTTLLVEKSHGKNITVGMFYAVPPVCLSGPRNSSIGCVLITGIAIGMGQDGSRDEKLKKNNLKAIKYYNGIS